MITIGRYIGNNEVASVVLHDNDIERISYILKNYYTNDSLVQDLLDVGDLNYLGENPDICKSRIDYINYNKDGISSYSDNLQDISSVREFLRASFQLHAVPFLFKDGYWLTYENGQWRNA